MGIAKMQILGFWHAGPVLTLLAPDKNDYSRGSPSHWTSEVVFVILESGEHVQEWE